MTNPLTDLIPAKYRRYVYAVAACILFVYGLYLAADGDWVAFALAIIGSLVPATAHANTAK